MPTVTNTVLKPDGSLAGAVRVRIRLVASDPIGAPGFVGATDRTIISESFVLTSTAGIWSAVLEPNANISPTGTVYEITENVGVGVAPYYVTVPVGAGPYWAGDLLSVAPTSLVSPLSAPVLRTPRYTQGIWDWGREWEYGVASPTHTRPTVNTQTGFNLLTDLLDYSANPDPNAFYYTTGPDIVGAVPYTPTVNSYVGTTFPAGKYVTLPPGLWLWNGYVYFWTPSGTVVEGGSPGSIGLRHLDEFWDDPVQGGPIGSVGNPLLRQVDVLTRSDVIAGKQEMIVTSGGFLVLPDLGPSKLHHLGATTAAQHVNAAGTVVLAGLTFTQVDG
jgi:hypothetical protein